MKLPWFTSHWLDLETALVLTSHWLDLEPALLFQDNSLSEGVKDEKRLQHAAKETEFLRLKRSRLGVDDFEPLKVDFLSSYLSVLSISLFSLSLCLSLPACLSLYVCLSFVFLCLFSLTLYIYLSIYLSS